MIEYVCHGAAREVTGSCHLLRCGAHNILIDCGQFQGGREHERANAEPFGFDPASIDAVLLTHAHLDHCGRIPKLVREGFRGRIHATAATRDLARVVLLDAASLQEEDARRAARKGREGTPPLFTIDDALHSMDFFVTTDYGKPFDVVAGVRASFRDAGHILGSASILLELADGERQRRMIFSGDLGNAGRPILRDPQAAPPAEYVVMETTYGNRAHRSLSDSVEEFHRAVEQTLARGGNVIIPTFAMERAQEVLYYLHQGLRQGRVPGGTPVFLDSPMAISATDIFRRHPECYDDAFRELLRHDDPFTMPNLHFSRESSESMAINRIEGGAIILAGSGMCDGGRVRHHLRHNLWREKSSIVFVGYAAAGTLARRIIDGARSVRLFDEEIRVRAQLWTINGFSAHADQAGLLAWLGDAPRRQVFLVHGDYEVGMQAMAQCLRQREVAVRMPGKGEPILLE